MKQSESQETKKDKNILENKKQKYIVIGITVCIICGIILTSFPISSNKNEVQSTQVGIVTKEASQISYEEQLEQRLEAILKKLEGAGAVQVMITTSTSQQKELAEEVTYNVATTKEQDNAGGMRVNEKEDRQNKVVLAKDNMPIVVKETKPKVEGVLILAQGGEDIVVKTSMIQAVSSLLNLPSHKISVLKMVQN